MLKAYPKVNVTEYLTLWICTDGILSSVELIFFKLIKISHLLRNITALWPF